jgi:hypothetical protein
MGFPIVDGVLSLVNTVGGLFGNWQKKKLIQAQGKVKIAEAKVAGEIALQDKIATGDISYDVAAQQGMQTSWKDEWLTIVLSGVFIACFIPYLQPYLKDGFAFLKTSTPWWYEWSFTGMIAASFGLRGWKMFKGGANGKI